MMDYPMLVHVRWMIRRDIPEVMAIMGSLPHRIDAAELEALLRQQNAIGMIAEHGGRVAGWMAYTLHRGKIELEWLAVHPDCRGLGVGSQLMAKLEGKLSPGRRTRIEVWARESDLAGLAWLRRMGFLAGRDAIHGGYFEDTGEDAYRMVYRLPRAAEVAA